MSGTRRAKTRNRDCSTSGDDEESQTPPRTFDLFTVSGESPATDVATAATTGPASKNPRWLASHEKEVRSEALRDKILGLICEIEAEEAEEKPALKKAWLHAKKMELRRISFKPPDGIIAGEASFRRARRKLREARRRRRPDGGDKGDSDCCEGSASGDEAGPEAATDAGKKAGHRRWTVSGAASADQKLSGSEPDGEESSKDGVFNLNPAGRIAQPNPRAKPLDLLDAKKTEKKLPKTLQKMSKIVRFPLESGFKLGRMIRNRREKGRRHSSSATSGSESVASGEWGERVRASNSEESSNSNHRRSRQRGKPDAAVRPASSSTTASSTNVGGGDGAREIVIIGDSEGEDGRTRGSRSRSSSRGSSDAGGSSIAEIPELQESVGKKLRDRLALKEKPREKKETKEKKKKATKQEQKLAERGNGRTDNASLGQVRSSAGEPIECVELENGAD